MTLSKAILLPAHVEAIGHRVIGCGITVHRALGPGLLESLYERAMAVELRRAGLSVLTQVEFPVVYAGESIGVHRIDMVVEDAVVVEIKAVDSLLPVFTAQVLSYLRVADKPLGLLMNFGVSVLRDGIKRVIHAASVAPKSSVSL